MENAHQRLGLLEYQRMTEKTTTRIRVRVERYVGEDRQAHLLSVFGNDSDVGAITAAVHEKATFNLTFPDGTTKDISFGEHASCYKGSATLPDRKYPVRHLLAVSQALHTNGGVGRTTLLRYQRDEAWATLVSFLGLPGDPAWADHVLSTIEAEERITEIDGIGRARIRNADCIISYADTARARPADRLRRRWAARRSTRAIRCSEL
jgi:hypothetical protein